MAPLAGYHHEYPEYQHKGEYKYDTSESASAELEQEESPQEPEF
jgi:hypothetical protein